MENEMLAMTILAAVAGAAASVPNSPSIRRDVEVPITDLDLSRPSDVAELDRRLQRAAWKACGPLDGTNPLAWALVKECHADALERARADARARFSKS